MQQSTLPFDSVQSQSGEPGSEYEGSQQRLDQRLSVVTLRNEEAPDDGDSRHASPLADSSATVHFVRHPRARRYLIRVRLDGSVRVTIPRRGSKREAAAFFSQQQSWVASQQRRVRQLRETIPEDLPPDVQKRLRREARNVLPARLRELAAQVGVTVSRISIRNQRHRWGSCSATGAIALNWRLVTMPDWVRDYVIYHELMHTKRMDHSATFWALVKQVCPNYEEARRWLRRHAHAPHAATC